MEPNKPNLIKGFRGCWSVTVTAEKYNTAGKFECDFPEIKNNAIANVIWTSGVPDQIVSPPAC